MATPADQRLLDLLDKWLVSLELHGKYASLDEDSYSKIQPWPEHQRPSRWIIDLARQKAMALKAQIEERVKMGDAKFSDSLELMTFLANLVGSEHIERFIPVADPSAERKLNLQPPDGDTTVVGAAVTGTREMPKFVPGKSREPAPAGTAQVARTERKSEVKAADKAAPSPKPTASKSTDIPVLKVPRGAPPEVQAAAPPSGPSAEARDQVIADAARLVQWGRKWYELAEIIAKMADRPHLTDVRRILKDNKAAIEKKAGRG